jgi:hypothetical protein
MGQMGIITPPGSVPHKMSQPTAWMWGFLKLIPRSMVQTNDSRRKQRILLSLCLYTEGDDLRNENPSKAIEMFEKVVEMETKQGDQVKW